MAPVKAGDGSGPQTDRPEEHHAISGLSGETVGRYREMLMEAQRRAGYTEMLNDEFFKNLLDVYEYHLEECADEGDW